MALEDTLAWYLSDANPTLASLAPEVGAGAAGAAGGLFSSLGSLAGAAVIPTYLNFISNQIAQGKVDRYNSQMANMALQDAGLAAGVPLEAWDVTNYQDVANTPAPEQRYDGTWSWNGQVYGTPLAAPSAPPSATAVAGIPDPTSNSVLGQIADFFTGGDQALVFNPATGTVSVSSTYPNSSTPTGSYVPVGPTVGGIQPGMTTGSNVLDMLILAGAQATGMGTPNVATPTAGDILGGAVKDVIGKDILGTIQAGAQLAPVNVVKTQEEQAAEAKALEEEAKTKVIIDWLGKYPNASDSFIRATMEDNNITPADMAKATGVPLSAIQARYDKALPSTLAIDPTLTGKDTAAQVALDAAVAKAASDAAAAKIASDAAAAKIASDAAAAKIASDAAVAAQVPTTLAVVAPTESSTPIASKTITTTPTVSTPIVTGGLLDTPPAVAPVAPVVPAAPPAVAPVVNVDVNNNGVIDAEEPPKLPVVPATPPVIPVTPTPPPPPTSGGGLFSSPTRTTDLLFGDPYKYQRDKFTLLDNLLSYGRY
jgi:hypothetical protein